MAGCVLPQRWPLPAAGVRRLKYIGRLFEDRWQDEGISTLQEMQDLVAGQTRAQNKALFERVYENQNGGECVPRTDAEPAKNLPNPWPNPPHNPSYRNGKQGANASVALTPGNFEYCVRNYNKCAWACTRAYLQARLPLAQQGRIPLALETRKQDEFCRTNPNNWCKVPAAAAPIVVAPAPAPVAAAPPAPVTRAGRVTKLPDRFKGGAKKEPTMTVKYFITNKSPSFANTIKKTLSNKAKGIASLSNIRYSQVMNKKNADIIVHLLPQSKIDKKCGKDITGLSCSIVSMDHTIIADEILFSRENWMGKSNYKGNLTDYRTYVINHEFLHCYPFHLDHPSAKVVAEHCKEQRPIPVMYQQSRGLPPDGKCQNNSWPLKSEIIVIKQ